MYILSGYLCSVDMSVPEGNDNCLCLTADLKRDIGACFTECSWKFRIKCPN